MQVFYALEQIQIYFSHYSINIEIKILLRIKKR